jgi:hypothetical protein
MTIEFGVDDEWQRKQRDTILVPLFYERFYPGGYTLLDGCDPKQREGWDTLVETAKGQRKVEEKIVRRRRDGKQYDSFSLETMSCSVQGRERDGWMLTSTADLLLYCFSTLTEIGLDVYVLDMPALQTWFWASDLSRWKLTRSEQDNHGECRVVPISEATHAIIKRYLIGPGWKDSHFCEVCHVEAAYGFGVRLLQGKRGRWFCNEHKPLT